MMRATLVLVAFGAWPMAANADQSALSEQQSFRNIPYYTGPDANPVRHVLDVHVPKGQKNFPVIFFVHGGGWVQGNKDHLGVYSVLARTFNRYGIGVVCPNYRLSPEVQHPEHIRDVARAFAWTYKNIHKYGGRNDELFVSGHSAGGHLCALLATDTSYLKAEGLPTNAIKGVMPISGLFTIPAGKMFDVAFGKDSLSHGQASPINHVHADLPPFLILFGDHDLPACDRHGAEAFCKAVRGKGCQAEMREIPSRNHVSILWSAINDTDPAMQDMLSFVMAQVTLDRLSQGDAAAIGDFGSFLARYAEYVALHPKMENKNANHESTKERKHEKGV
jgi:acetyl esterase/lipase